MSKLFIKNLNYASTEDELRTFVESQGFAVEQVNIIYDRDTGKSKGFGFVLLEQTVDSQKVIEALNGIRFGGRNLYVESARPRENVARQ